MQHIKGGGDFVAMGFLRYDENIQKMIKKTIRILIFFSKHMNALINFYIWGVIFKLRKAPIHQIKNFKF